jgi:acid phosphatase (class A)
MTGSAAFALDEQYSRRSLAMHDTPAWALAILDADMTFPNAASRFSCALNAPITKQGTPHLYKLLQRTLIDAGLSTKTAKEHYKACSPLFVEQGTYLHAGIQRKAGEEWLLSIRA